MIDNQAVALCLIWLHFFKGKFCYIASDFLPWQDKPHNKFAVGAL
jgi:hypothetical protein